MSLAAPVHCDGGKPWCRASNGSRLPTQAEANSKTRWSISGKTCWCNHLATLRKSNPLIHMRHIHISFHVIHEVCPTQLSIPVLFFSYRPKSQINTEEIQFWCSSMVQNLRYFGSHFLTFTKNPELARSNSQKWCSVQKRAKQSYISMKSTHWTGTCLHIFEFNAFPTGLWILSLCLFANMYFRCKINQNTSKYLILMHIPGNDILNIS